MLYIRCPHEQLSAPSEVGEHAGGPEPVVRCSRSCKSPYVDARDVAHLFKPADL